MQNTLSSQLSENTKHTYSKVFPWELCSLCLSDVPFYCEMWCPSLMILFSSNAWRFGSWDHSLISSLLSAYDHNPPPSGDQTGIEASHLLWASPATPEVALPPTCAATSSRGQGRSSLPGCLHSNAQPGPSWRSPPHPRHPPPASQLSAVCECPIRRPLLHLSCERPIRRPLLHLSWAVDSSFKPISSKV